MRILVLIFLVCSLIIACNNTQKTIEEKPKDENIDKNALYGDLYTYYSTNPKDQFEKDQNAIIEYCAERLLNPKRTPTGFFIMVERNGEGPSMKWGEQVTAHYKGYFLDDKVFDSSYSRGEPLTFRVGNMMKAWNDALLMLGKGAKVKLFIPSKVAYGEKGFPGYVPPNTPLIFDIEVLK